MRVRGAKTLRRVVRQLRSRWTDSAVVLGYHRVAAVDSDPYGIVVRPDHFARQLETIRRLGRPLRLATLIGGLEEDRVPPRGIAVTFDDVYADFRDEALPLLERFEVPATLFVVSGRLGGTLWWDLLDRAVAAGALGPDRPPLVVEGEPLAVEMGGGAPTPEGFRDALYRRLRALPPARLAAAVEELAGRVNAGPAGEKAPRLLGRDELRGLAGECPLLDFGSHTVSHPDLSLLSEAACLEELRASREELRAVLDREVEGLSFPFGRVPRGGAGLAAGAGYRYACTSREDALRTGTGAYEVPRLWPPDLAGDPFAAWLGRWL